ncbi:Cerato-platanin [Choiromyces venosus 120613-1]|uniref:Cerato-platanin n=1 Tax=Choiromyces venosus 120613-1 TaxID=1336337 RepID=A0A3N4K0U8_9PEZI|nr:Cerato-platanin [Choiromyces venosus 120613-1]
MQFLKTTLLLTTTLTLTLAQTAGVAKYDPTYDNASLSTLAVACSDGVNGLYTKGYKTLGSIPGFPNLGGSGTITGWNSPNCGACYELTYTPPAPAAPIVLNIVGVDVAAPGTFVLSQTALDTLTGGQAVMLGAVNVIWKPVAASACGF